MVYSLPRRLEALFLPPACLLCDEAGADGLDLCPRCIDALPRNRSACSGCARPLPEDAPRDGLCGRCSRTPPAHDRMVAPWRYEGELADLIRRLKFRRELAAGRTLGLLLAREIRRLDTPLPQLVLPVPLHPRQLRSRGFNHAAELAYAVSRELGLPWSTRLLRKERHTEHQHTLDRGARLKNLRGAFRYLGNAGYHHVAVVDDVVTTGATAAEVTRTLKAAGIRKVEIWAVARTPES